MKARLSQLSQLSGLSRLTAIGLAALLLLTGCIPAGSQPTSVGDPPATAAPVEQPVKQPVRQQGLQRGVALSPRSYEGSDLPDFFDIIDGPVDLVMHAADWAELADETSAFRVMSELAMQRNLDTMVVLSPSNGTQLLRPLDEETTSAYLESLGAFLDDYQPNYLGLGNELNLVESDSADHFDQTVALFDAALEVVRLKSPDTTVFVTLQYEWLLGRRDGWFGRENDPTAAQWDLIKRFEGADAVGITTYPGLVFEHPDDIPADYYDQLRSYTDLPIIITESGWTADPDIAGLAGSADEQDAFAKTVLDRADRLQAPAVVWTFLFSTQVAEPAFSEMGLWTDDATPRRAWASWTGSTSPLGETPPAEPVTGLSTLWTVPFTGELPLTVVADQGGRPYVYVAAKNGGVAVVSTAEGRGEIVDRVSRQELGGDAMHLTQHGNLLLVALGDFFADGNRAGIATIDIRDPTSVVVEGTWLSQNATGGSADIVAEGPHAYLAAMEFGIIAIDLTRTTDPTPAGQLQPDPDFPRPNPDSIARPNARGLHIRDGWLFVANDAGGLRVLDATDPANLREVGRYINPQSSKQQAYNDVVVAGDFAFVSLDYCGFEVIDVSDYENMRQVAWLDPWGCNEPTNLWLNSAGHGNELFYDKARSTIWMSAGDSEVLAIDVSDPRTPTILATVGEPANNRGTYGLGASTGLDATVYATYITTIVPFQGRSSEIVALKPS